MDYYEKYMKYKNKYLHAKHTLGSDMSGGTLTPDESLASKKIYIFFQDVADADNFMSVVAFIKLYGYPTVDNPIHFVLTQRPENLGVPKAYADGPIKSELWNVDDKRLGPDVPEDALLVAEDGARRFIMFMHKNYKIGETLKEAYEIIRVYDGGLPIRSSNMSHVAHKRDYLFDRADLLDPPREIGTIITANEYFTLERQYNMDGPKKYKETEQKEYDYKADTQKTVRQANLRTAINVGLILFKEQVGKTTNLLRPLEELISLINTKQRSLGGIGMRSTIPVVAFLLAPLTGFANLFRIDNGRVLQSYLTHVYGQLFAWDVAVRAKLDHEGKPEVDAKTQKQVMDPETYTINPNGVNIFRNQFNIDCDTDSFDYVGKQLETCRKLTKILWVPTEMLKGGENNQFYSSLYNAEKGLLDHDVLNKIAVSASLKEKIEENIFLKKLVKTPLMKLWSQWSGIKTAGQPIFDPSVIFVAHDDITSNTSRNMIIKTEPIEYIKHNQRLYMRKFPHQETGPDYDRPVYQIKITDKKTIHSAVHTLNTEEHFRRLLDLLTYEISK